jgi:DNA-binding transcriptional regulator YhcF (GntR family)
MSGWPASEAAVEAVYHAVVEWFDTHHWPPSRRDLAIATGYSPSTVQSALMQLRDAGRLKVAARGVARGIGMP